MAEKFLPLLEGATVGVLGGGQLGNFFTSAAKKLGFKVAVMCPDEQAPAIRSADIPIIADYDDPLALEEMANKCEAITVEFENLPVDSLAYLARHTRLSPGANALQVTQNRIREKELFAGLGLPVAPYMELSSENDWDRLRNNGSNSASSHFPAILKTAAFGYDGKGQWNIEGNTSKDISEACEIWRSHNRPQMVLEKRQRLFGEISLIVMRSSDGDIDNYPAVENIHHKGILDMSMTPVPRSEWIDMKLLQQADAYARRIIARLDYVGVMGIEFFVTDNGLMLNEIAPRPHNSGHFTLDAAYCSQFEQQVRIMAGWPLGSTECHSKAIMVNLLGDLWSDSPVNSNWDVLLQEPGLSLHIYGKPEARRGRKMGHFSLVGDSHEELLERASRLRKNLGIN